MSFTGHMSNFDFLLNLTQLAFHSKSFPFTATAIFKPKVCTSERITCCFNRLFKHHWYPVKKSCHCINAQKPHKITAEEVNLLH